MQIKLKIIKYFIYLYYHIDLMYSPFITLSLGLIVMDLVTSELCYKETVLQRNYVKTAISWSFSHNSFVKSLADYMVLREPQHGCDIAKFVL